MSCRCRKSLHDWRSANKIFVLKKHMLSFSGAKKMDQPSLHKTTSILKNKTTKIILHIPNNYTQLQCSIMTIILKLSHFCVFQN